MAAEYIVMLDVDAIQSWLFASVRLSEIAGASQLLVEFDDDIAGLAARYGGDALSTTGGAAVVVFADDAKAKQFIQEVRVEFRRRAVTGWLSAAGPIKFNGSPSFRNAREEAARALEQEKRLGHPHDEPADLPFARRCQSCGAEPATTSREINGEVEWLGHACTAKRSARHRTSWLNRLELRDRAVAKPARDFDELTGHADPEGRGSLAVVVADGNSIGERLRKLDRTEHRDFSRALDNALRAALSAAACRVLESWQGSVLPLEVLFCGGDDTVVACRGDLGLPFAQTLVETFYTRAAAFPILSCHGGPLSLSAAIAITNPTFPFLVAHDIADQLLRHAKREARLRGFVEGVIDFVRITESFADAGAVLRDRRFADDAGEKEIRLTARPFRAVKRGPRSLGGYQEACRRLRTNGFPRNKLFALRERASAAQLCGAPNSPVYPLDVGEAVARLNGFLGDWRRRVRRQPAANKTWDDVCQLLGADGNALVEVKKDAEWCLPFGDLAEGLDLWGA
jgi:hypothetical protein